MLDKTRPMQIGDIFSNSINLIKNTFTRNIAIAAIFLIPTGLIFSYGLDAFFNEFPGTIQQLVDSPSEDQISLVLSLYASMGIIALTYFVFSLGLIAASVGVFITGSHEIEGRRISIGETITSIFTNYFWKSLGQLILKYLALSGIIFVSMILLILSAVFDNNGLTIAGVLIFIVGMIYTLYLYLNWFFSVIGIIYDDNDIIEGFRNSSRLIKGHWWRTFGILILISIAVEFVISLVTAPISFIILWGYISKYMDLFLSPGATDDPAVVFDLFKNFAFSVGLIVIVNSILEIVVKPLFYLTMYCDLKIRKNDYVIPFPEETGDTPEVPSF